MSFLSYPKLRDSGLEWLGSVPEKWAVLPLRSFAKEDPNAFTDGDWIESPYITDEGVRLIQTGNIGIGKYKEQGFRYVSPDTFVKLRCTEVSPGDVLICRLAEPVGRACIAPELGFKCITSVDVCILKIAKEQSAKYLTYFLSSTPYLQFMDAVARGGTRQRVSRSFLGSVRTPVPSFPEQTQIACFLDHETAKIDALIREQERLIKLLQEKRQAVISHAVTKGLDPDVPMKDSGVEWLGEVPAHWEVMPVKFLLSLVTSGSRGWAEFYSDEGELFFRIANLTRDSIRPKLKSTQHVTLPKDSEGSRARIQIGDILVSITADLGSVCAADRSIEGGYVSQHVALARPQVERCYSEWLAFFILGDAAKEQLLGSGYGGTKVQLSLEDIRELVVVVPLMDEQIAIASMLHHRLASIEMLITEANKTVALLSERRSALISAAVTGKIDVREWQPPADESAFDKEVRQSGLEAIA